MERLKKHIKLIILLVLIIVNLIFILCPVSLIGEYRGQSTTIKFKKETVKTALDSGAVYIGFYDIKDNKIFIKDFEVDSNTTTSLVFERKNVFCIIKGKNTFKNVPAILLQVILALIDFFLIIFIIIDKVEKRKQDEDKGQQQNEDILNKIKTK